MGLRSYIQVRLIITLKGITELRNHDACISNIKNILLLYNNSA